MVSSDASRFVTVISLLVEYFISEELGDKGTKTESESIVVLSFTAKTFAGACRFIGMFVLEIFIGRIAIKKAMSAIDKPIPTYK